MGFGPYNDYQYQPKAATGGGGMNPYVMAGTAALQFGSGLLSGGETDGRTDDEKYYSGKLLKEQRSAMEWQNKFSDESFWDRMKALRLQNEWNQEAYGQSKLGFQRLGDVYDRSRGMMGTQINDPRQNLGLMQQAMRPQQMALINKYSRSGMRNSGAIAGGLAKQQMGQQGGYLLNAMDRESYERSHRDQGLLGLQASLYR